MNTPAQNRKFIEEYITAINQDRSDETLNKYIQDQSLKDRIHRLQKGIPNYQLYPQFMVAEGNKVAVHLLVEAVHKGELFGIAPTGRKLKANAIVIYEVENNKIVNHWLEMDTMALINKLKEEPVAVET